MGAFISRTKWFILREYDRIITISESARAVLAIAITVSRPCGKSRYGALTIYGIAYVRLANIIITLNLPITLFTVLNGLLFIA